MELLLAITAAYFIMVLFTRVTAPKVTHISGKEIDTLLKDKQSKKQFIDVRTANEFNGRKVKGFNNIPLDQLGRRVKELNPELPVVVMCASGSRSMRAARILSKNGFKQIINVKGGISTYPSK